MVAGASAVATVWFVASSLPSEPSRAPLAAAREDARGAQPVASVPPGAVLPSVAADAAAPGAAPPEPTRARAPASRRQPGVAQRPPRGASASPSTAAAEAALLERARAALGGDPAGALALAEQHRRRFPHGALVQEREVIAIDALKRLGRADAASVRAAAFEHRYRGSVHRPRLERSTDTSLPPEGEFNTAP
jgi:hypothetical protein